ncbi:hypothetical protein [Rhodococcus sp. X156]|uniref:hypothetical protein n=1 Tax=Rhodococcus sp. X156 TaxID=2499145 RepID=UPI000FD98EDA|nr:hypothetical protein [Rhodococcus sp. X156]
MELELLVGTSRARPMSWVHEKSVTSLNVRPADLVLAVSTVARRARVLGDRYPIEVTNSGFKRRSGMERTPYGAMLLVTTGIPLVVLPRELLAEAAQLFEIVVTESARSLLGEGAEAVRFGYPGEPGRPPEFPQAIPWLVDLMRLKGGTAYRDPARKDGGVDVVAWRPFPDGRPGFPIHLVQVTLEKNFSHKAGDINSRLWSLLLGLDVDPTAVLAIPRTLPEDKRWAEVATRAILLERVRIAGLLPSQLPVLSEHRWASLIASLELEYRDQLAERAG